MNSKAGQSNPSDIGGTYDFPMDGCNHLISTSLRDLRKKYKDLSHAQVEPVDLNKKCVDKIDKGTKLDLKQKN